MPRHNPWSTRATRYGAPRSCGLLGAVRSAFDLEAFGMLSCGRLPSASFLADENAKLIHDKNVTRVDSRAGIGPSVNGAVAAISDTPGTVVALGLFLTRWDDEHKGATAEPADAAL